MAAQALPDNPQLQRIEFSKPMWLLHPADGELIDIRIKYPPDAPQRVADRVFRSVQDAAAYVQEQCSQYDVEAVWQGLNHIRADAAITRGVADSDIDFYTHLLVDLDPDRPADSNSTDAELAAAAESVRRIREGLTAQGWPDPIEAMSGNGHQLVFQIGPPIPNTPENKELIKAVLNRLGDLYDNAEVHVDRKVYNPSRVVKLWGTPTRKGPHSTERPQRRSWIIPATTTRGPVTAEQLRDFIGDYTPQAAQRAAAAKPSALAAGGKIQQGNRNDTMFRLSCALRNQGLAGQAIWDAIKAQNIAVCVPPLSQDELREIVKGVIKHYEPGDPAGWRGFDDSRLPVDETEPEPVDETVAETPASISGLSEDVAVDWEAQALVLDGIRDSMRILRDDDGNPLKTEMGAIKKTRIPNHIRQEEVRKFCLDAIRQRAKLFVDGFGYAFLTAERRIIRLGAGEDIPGLLGRLHLRATQPDTDLIREELEQYALEHGERSKIERLGCWRNQKCYINTGRNTMLRLDGEKIDQLACGDDGVYMLIEGKPLLPWPELTSEWLAEIATVQERLAGKGMLAGDTPLCRQLMANYDEEGGFLVAAQYRQLLLSRVLSFWLRGVSSMRPILLATGEQNTGKSTLFDRIMWTLYGPDYESGALPTDIRSFLAAVTSSSLRQFDNIDGADLTGYWDYLCKSASGGDVSIAVLYRTNVERLYTIHCDLMLTARQNPSPSHRSDVSRRILHFPLAPSTGRVRGRDEMRRETAALRHELLTEIVARLGLVVRALRGTENYVVQEPISQMVDYETYTMRVADYEGWGAEMQAIWTGVMGQYRDAITEDAPLVMALRRWLGRGLNSTQNVGRELTSAQLYDEMARQQGDEFTRTYRNASAFGRALRTHMTTLRVLGVQRRKSHEGVRFVSFRPDADELARCLSAAGRREAQTQIGLEVDDVL